MSILDVELSPGVAAGFTGGPEFNTRIKSLANKRERRNANWDDPRHRWTAPFNNISSVEFRDIKRVFLVCKAQVYGFFFKDPADHTATGESLGNAPSGTTAVALKVTSTADGVSYVRTNFQAYPGLRRHDQHVHADDELDGRPAADMGRNVSRARALHR